MSQLQTETIETTATISANRAANDPRHLPVPVQLAAYNAAFVELELPFQWDEPMFAWLCGIECERGRVARYIEDHHAHLLRAYEPDFLSTLIFDKKNEYLRAVGHIN